ncbi:BLUF domain-containing protein [Nocardioides pacificus]
MLSLTYLSSATELMGEADLEAMLTSIRPRNAARGLSGMLLYSGGNIIQTLEGPEPEVRETFDRIGQDPRHRGLILMLEEPIVERAFPDWSMGYRQVRRDYQPEGFTAFLQQSGPRDTNVGPAERLLRVFKESMR